MWRDWVVLESGLSICHHPVVQHCVHGVDKGWFSCANWADQTNVHGLDSFRFRFHQVFQQLVWALQQLIVFCITRQYYAMSWLRNRQSFTFRTLRYGDDNINININNNKYFQTIKYVENTIRFTHTFYCEWKVYGSILYICVYCISLYLSCCCISVCTISSLLFVFLLFCLFVRVWGWVCMRVRVCLYVCEGVCMCVRVCFCMCVRVCLYVCEDCVTCTLSCVFLWCFFLIPLDIRSCSGFNKPF